MDYALLEKDAMLSQNARKPRSLRESYDTQSALSVSTPETASGAFGRPRTLVDLVERIWSGQHVAA